MTPQLEHSSASRRVNGSDTDCSSRYWWRVMDCALRRLNALRGGAGAGLQA